MGTTLSGTKIKDTYDGLIKTSNNAAVGSSNIELTDGVGNDINISINNTGALTADGNITGASIIKTGGTSTQLLLANGAVVTLTLETSGIGSNDSDTKVPSNAAVKDYVDTQITNLIDSSPTALDTLNELAAALGDDANFSTTVNTALGNRLRIDVNSQGLTTTQKTNGLTNLGVTADPAELNILDGATLSTAELNFVDGVTSAIQTQIDAKQDELTAGTGISISGTTIATDLTNLVGTGAIQSDAVTAIKIAQFDDNLTAATGGDILVSNGTDFDNVTMSGDVTIASSGATTIGSGAVETGMIAADAVTGAKIADDAVDSEHLAAGAIDTEHIADSQVTTAKIAADAINSSKIADDAVDSEHLAAGAIDTEHIANAQVTDAKLANAKQNVKETHSTSAQTFTVTVATKTSAHRYNGSGSNSGFVIDGVQAPYITITAGNTYKFDQSDSSNSSHPLAFYYESDKTTSYSTGVTTSGTAGSSGAYTQIIATDATPTVLHYQCTNHGLMGNTVNFDTRNLTGFDTADLTEGTNLYYTDARFDTRLAAKDTDNLTEGSSNLYFSDERAQDAAASMITGGSHTNLTATYNDGSNTIDLAVSGGGSVSDAFKNIAVSGQSNIVADASTDTLTVAAGDNITLTTNASTDTLTIASTASGSGTLTIEQQTFSGDGSDTTFTLSSSCDNENKLQVYIDGVYQSKSNFSVSGNTLTFSTAPATGTDNIEVIHLEALAGTVQVDTFTGDGSDTTFDLTTTISSENNTQVYLDGVYQSKDNYSISGTTINFSTAPANNVAIEVVHLLPSGDVSINAIDSSDDAIIRLSSTNGATDDVKLVAGSNITLTPSGDNITIASNVSTSYSVSVISSNTTAVANTLYVLTATLTLTLPASPSAGDSVKVSNRSGVATAVIARNSEKIMGATSDLTLDKLNAGFELIYSGSAQGWILIGVEGTAA